MRRPILPLVLLAAAACAVPQDEEPRAPDPSLLDVVRTHLRRYPSLRPEDLYHLVWQATLGPAPVYLGQQSGLDTGLWREIRDLEPSPFPDPDDEPLLDPLSPEKDLVRVNLRPYLRRGGTAGRLARAVAETSRTFRGDRGQLHASLELLADAIERGEIVCGFGAAAFRRLVRERAAAGDPPGLHSRAYAETYAPAYRVVRRGLLDPSLLGL